MSGSYNRFERGLAGLLSGMPGIKRFVKQLYQWLNYTFRRKEKKWDSEFVLKSFEYDKRETFFGYYDKCPESPNGRYVLYHAVNPPSTHLPLPEEIAYVVVYDQENEEVVMECSTTSFNWQQGARAMWLDDDKLIFNDYDAVSDRHVSRMISVSEKKVVKTFNIPVYDVAGDTAVSLNFDRLHLMRPDYGYRDRNQRIVEELLDERSDGIFKLDMSSGKHKIFISLSMLKALKPQDSLERARHWVNHLMISPDGSRLIFLHRWKKHGRVYHRLIHTPMESPGPELLAEGMVSHCCWYDNSRIIAYLGGENRPANYYVIDLQSGGQELLADGKLEVHGDGHPSVFGDCMLFDTYPDRHRVKDLMVMDMEDSSLRVLGRFFEALKYNGPSRCDLHPRWSRDGKTIYFDSVHSGNRRLYSMTIDA